MKADERIPSLLAGRYRLVRVIGRGGMSTVYEGVQEGLGRTVAVKLLPAHLVKKPRAVERFRREAETSAALSHPNIVQVTDFGVTDDAAFLVMEYLKGESLGDLLAVHSALNVGRVAWIASQALSAMAAAHKAGIIHRDLKPDNLYLITVSGIQDVVKILDFGIAKLLGSREPQLTGNGMVLGTPAYMSPEQARGESVDERTDIYSLGAVMYEALSGRPLHLGNSYNAILASVLEREPQPLWELCPDLSSELVAIVMKSVERHPDSRFETAREMRKEIEPHVPALRCVVTPHVPLTRPWSIRSTVISAPNEPIPSGTLSTMPPPVEAKSEAPSLRPSQRPFTAVLRTHSEAADHLVATYGNVLMTVWRTSETFMPIEKGIEALPGLIREQGGDRRLGSLTRITAAGVPPEPLRRAITEFFQSNAPHFAAAAIVVDATGFGGAALRGAVTTIIRHMRVDTPVRVFGSAEHAGRWLREQLWHLHRFAEGELDAVIEEL